MTDETAANLLHADTRQRIGHELTLRRWLPGEERHEPVVKISDAAAVAMNALDAAQREVIEWSSKAGIAEHRLEVAQREVAELRGWKQQAMAMGDAALANWVLRVAERDERIEALEAALAMHSLCPTCGGINAHTLPCAYYEVLRAALAGLPGGKP